MWQGGYRVFAGGITQGEVVALVNYMTQILVALLALSNLIVQMARGSASTRLIPPRKHSVGRRADAER